VRLTYLQAKSERATLHSVCGRAFSANLEQWFLLSSRPTISGIGAFTPPFDLLSNALLPSVGSFAFFYKDGAGEFQTYYATANHLYPSTKTFPKRYGKLQAAGRCMVVCKSGYAECLAACGNKSFAESLYRLEIGTPMDSKIPQVLSSCNWLTANLRLQIQEAKQTGRQSAIAEELLDLLGPGEDQSASSSFGAKKLIIIKSSAQQDNFFTHRG
jgi:hypothetical protein